MQHLSNQRFSEILLGKRCPKTAKVDPKTTIAGKSSQKTKVFPEKDNYHKKNRLNSCQNARSRVMTKPPHASPPRLTPKQH
jgi:hypothetical protein